MGRDLTSHEVRTAPQSGWASLKNGELLRRAQAEFDVFITTDQNLEHQQDIRSFSIAVVVLRAKTNRLSEADALAAIAATESETGLPADDPVRFGSGKLLDAVLAAR